MNTQLTPNDPRFTGFLKVVEPTIFRYTKKGRYYEIHRNSQMMAMFGYSNETSFFDIPTSILHSIIYNFHQADGFDVTQEVLEEY
jgi:hypothetical protein